MNIFKNKKTRVLIIIMSTLFILAFFAVQFYYNYENESVDPRVLEANLLYEKYNKLAAASDYKNVLLLMDSIEEIYKHYPHYEKSYEVGVLYNNRAAAFISKAITMYNSDSLKKDSLLNIGLENVEISIAIYTDWLNDWGDKNNEQIIIMLQPHFNAELPEFSNKNLQRFIKKRVKEIKEAQHETPRRLSVAYTNKGLIHRHKEMYDDAVKYYIEALTLWPENIAAENNLNILMNKPLKKRSILRQLFPKDRINK